MTESEYQRLVEFLGRQFEAIDLRFGAIDERFGLIAHRFDAMDQHFERLERRMGEGFREVLGHFDELYRRLERLEQEYLVIVHALERIERLVGDERVRREVLEQSVAELRQQVGLLQARIDDLEQRIRR